MRRKYFGGALDYRRPQPRGVASTVRVSSKCQIGKGNYAILVVSTMWKRIEARSNDRSVALRQSSCRIEIAASKQMSLC